MHTPLRRYGTCLENLLDPGPGLLKVWAEQAAYCPGEHLSDVAVPCTCNALLGCGLVSSGAGRGPGYRLPALEHASLGHCRSLSPKMDPMCPRGLSWTVSEGFRATPLAICRNPQGRCHWSSQSQAFVFLFLSMRITEAPGNLTQKAESGHLEWGWPRPASELCAEQLFGEPWGERR